MNEGDSNGKQKTNVAYSNVDDGGRKPAANQPVGDVDGGVKSRTSIAGGGNELPVASGGGTFMSGISIKFYLDLGRKSCLQGLWMRGTLVRKPPMIHSAICMI